MSTHLGFRRLLSVSPRPLHATLLPPSTAAAVIALVVHVNWVWRVIYNRRRPVTWPVRLGPSVRPSPVNEIAAARRRLMSGRVSRRRWWVKTHSLSRPSQLLSPAAPGGGERERRTERTKQDGFGHGILYSSNYYTGFHGSAADETHSSLITS